jgi:hypothetical protein
MAYAEGTSVSVERSRAEIETILRKYGAAAFQHGWRDIEGKRVEQIDFLANDKQVRFVLVLPSKDEPGFRFRKLGNKKVPRTAEQSYTAWEQACRQKWRALTLCIKAKLEAVAAGITEFEHEFLAQVVDPESGKTVGEMMKPFLQGRLSVSSILGLPAPPGHSPGPEASGREPSDRITSVK